MIKEGELILGLILILFIIGIRITYKTKVHREERFDKWFLGIIITFTCALLLTAGIFPIIRWLDSDVSQTYKRTVNIASLRNSNEVNGHFSLGCGSIENVEYYYYYKFDGFGYTRGKKRVDKTVIVERDNCTPHIEVLFNQYKSKTGLFSFNDEGQEEYLIIVPKNTVVNKFEVF